MQTMILTLVKQTKNKLVYGSPDAPIPSVYIEKTALQTVPAKIKLSIEIEEQ